MKKVVLITGCSSGIGNALAIEFSKNNYQVVATARNLSSIQTLESFGIDRMKLDVLNNSEIVLVVKEVLAKYNRVDILINNAGYGLMAPILDITEDELNNQFLTNVYAPLRLIKEITPTMIKNKNGVIINVGSISGLVTTPFSGAYCASKAAIHSFSDALRMEIKPFGIKVLTVMPGAIKSNFGKQAIKRAEEIFKKNSFYSSLNSFILKRANGSQVVATPAENFAKAIVVLMNKNKYPANLLIGKKSFLLPFMKKILPTKVLDSILIKKFGLDKFQ
jgi:short-subunit dehydrogenase